MKRILIIDDDKAVLNYFLVLLTQTQHYSIEVLSDSAKSFDVIKSGNFDLILLDMDMPAVAGMDVLRYVHQNHPGLEVIIVTGVGDVELAVAATKMGAYDYLSKPVDINRLIMTVDRALERSHLREEVLRLRDQVSDEGLQQQEAFKGIITQDRSFLRTLQNVEQIAMSENNVLIWGESGTGKELVARAIHAIGRRRDKAFVAINAAALASELFASEFFGHEKGAFTGAVSTKLGLFEEANGGTLFLDEIGDIELPVQSKLLRVLQNGEYFRLGSTQKRGADVRVIAATNQDLDVEVEQGRFRRDLYYRLNISSIFLPPLRDRRGDVELLAYYFLERHSRQNEKTIDSISDEVLSIFDGYDFPGNVRELENIISGAVVLEASSTLTARCLPPALAKSLTVPDVTVPKHVRKTLAEAETEHIRSVMEHTGGNRTLAAQILGISRVGLLAKMKRHGVDIAPPSRGGGQRKRPADPTST
jgi:two-component system, NtrC family, response regulator HydG